MGDLHHFDCDFCDYTLDEHHWVRCDDQSACYLCGKTDFEITWENRYCFGPFTWLATTDADHTFHCGTCDETYTEPHHYLDGSACSCGREEAEPVVILGDASGDGVIDIMDALAVLQYAVGWGNTVYNEAADVNGDGACDILDALLILQYAVGWDVEFA